MKSLLHSRLGLGLAALGAGITAASAQQISGFAKLPAATFGAGPTSGQFITGANGISVPFVDKQPVQGFSAILNNGSGGYLVLTDNGFGAKGNSADSLLRFHDVSVDFKTTGGGSGVVTYNNSFTLSDPDKKVNFPIVADGTFYPNGANNIPVDPSIKNGRLLTGADFDIESFRKTPNGNLWFGDEFGPFLLRTDATGKVLSTPVPLPGVKSPSNPFGGPVNLPGSRGFEGMGQSKDGLKLYPILEGALTTEVNKRKLIINEFDTVTESYTGKQLLYQLDPGAGHHIGDMTPVGNDRYVITETDTSDTFTGFKQLFLIDFSVVDGNGFVQKTKLVDLLHISDPNHLASGASEYAMPFSTIEGLIPTALNKILVLNDNNYPFTNGRIPGTADNNEFVEIAFTQDLATMPVPEPGTPTMALGMALSALTLRRFFRKA